MIHEIEEGVVARDAAEQRDRVLGRSARRERGVAVGLGLLRLLVEAVRRGVEPLHGLRRERVGDDEVAWQ